MFRYPGGKSRVQNVILKYAPDTYSEYREPFVGGGGVFFAVAVKKTRWINDCHPGLIAVYKALRDGPDEFIRKCKKIQPMLSGEPEVPTRKNGKLYNKRLGEEFQKRVREKDKDPALSYFFINRTVWAGRVNYSIPSRLYYSNPEGWNIVKTNKLDLAGCFLKDTKITCGDFAPLLQDPGEEVFIYCDPPYVVNTVMSKADQQYEHNFTLEDHVRFTTEAKKCRHKLCISYDNCDTVRDLFAGSHFKIHEEIWTYSGTSQSTKSIGKELVITNY